MLYHWNLNNFYEGGTVVVSNLPGKLKVRKFSNFLLVTASKR